MDREALQATVHGVAKSQTRLSITLCISHSIPYFFTKDEKNRLRGGKITFLRSHKELTPTIILFQQHSLRAVVESGKQSQEK